MSVRSFVQSGMHFGKLAERKSDTFGVIELFDIGETDTVGAAYSDHSFQAHPVTWYEDLRLSDVLAKHAKARATEEQQIKIVERPRVGKKTLAEELRKLSHRDDKWVKPPAAKPAAAGANPDDAEPAAEGRTRQPRSNASRTPRTPRAAEAVDIPKGADKQLLAWVAQHGACKAIRLLVHANPTMNRLSVVELATQCKVHKTTAGVQYTNARRDISVGRTEGDESKKAKGAANKQAKAAPVPMDPLGMLAGLKAAAKAAKPDPTLKAAAKAAAKAKPAALAPEAPKSKAKAKPVAKAAAKSKAKPAAKAKSKSKK